MSKSQEKIVVENVNVPGHTTRVNREKYEAMKRALWKVIPGEAPGLTHVEMRDQAKKHLPDDLFPGGATAGWWAKTVQLDLEAKGQLVREDAKPLRWHRVD